MSDTKELRTIWISDSHLGCKAANPDKLLRFLKAHKCQYLFLVGDIIDIWELKRKTIHWSPECNEVIRRIIKMSRHARVVYITGNHDEFLNSYSGEKFGNIEIAEEAAHELLSGKHVLVTHGHQFDLLVRHTFVAKIGSVLYDYLIWLNQKVNIIRNKLGLKRWSLASYVKEKTKRACMFISNYESALIWEAETKGYEGVVCGHIHHAVVRQIPDQSVNSLIYPPNFLYCNCGDWIENCSVLVEHLDGKLEIMDCSGI